MNTTWINKSMALIFSLSFLTAAIPSFAQTGRGVVVIGQYTAAEADSLVFMIEEEKLARDVYLAMAEQWQTVVFSNIANSEQNHMDAIKRLVDAYGLEDPTQAIGVFTNAGLQTLYNDLIARGSVSELEALKVGALIEEVDIHDLKESLADATTYSVQQVYQNLMAGSENHLRAFAKTIEAQEGSYTAQLLTQEEVDLILSGSNTNQGGKRNRNDAQNDGQGSRRGQRSNRNATGNQNQAFVDANGDGICDSTGTANQSGQDDRRGRRGSRRN